MGGSLFSWALARIVNMERSIKNSRLEAPRLPICMRFEVMSKGLSRCHETKRPEHTVLSYTLRVRLERMLKDPSPVFTDRSCARLKPFSPGDRLHPVESDGTHM